MDKRSSGGLGILLACAFIANTLWSHRGTGPGSGQAQVEEMYRDLTREQAMAEYKAEPKSTPFNMWTELSGRVYQVRPCSDTPLDVCADMTGGKGQALTLRIDSACKPYPKKGRDILAKRALETSFPGQYSASGCPGWEYTY
jgi:hypothetical protein